ncbi:glycosyltransferase [Clostridium sardiniense]|uniref:Glycosyltransferase n=1 Tax=Clostridium sardiniense TaxID=29369 RepID=A0ABS7KSZ7_CLOSR|nr:glycosyltransferase [Clostridium sardiniense]MBY0753931.1 glycosyltransferase [Clostridium sardiniense]MDQ0459554.1 glycosyltransferase involved in cell wall biosynthesis [Clostridium sardiniense]
MDKYSVLMSIYEKEKPEYLIESLDSIINQTVPPDEIILVEDGPLNNVLYKTIDKYLNDHDILKVIKSSNNVGLGRALNLGLINCKNELIARMDTDDIAMKNRCEKQLIVFNNHNDLAIVGAAIDEFYENSDNIISTRVVPEFNKDIYNFSKRRSAFNHPVVMYKKSEVLRVGGYRDLRRNQDVDLFGRMLFNGCKAYNLQESLLLFRANKSLKKRRKSWENTKSYINVIYRFWKKGYSSLGDLCIVCISQIGMFLCPIKIQSLIYSKYLRK